MTLSRNAPAIDELPWLDIRSDAYMHDPVAVLRELRGQTRLARSERGIEVLTYREAAALFVDERLETPDTAHRLVEGATPAMTSFVDNGLLLNLERSRHDRVRKPFARAFTLRKVDQQREMMREVANSLVERFIDRGTCDFTAEFSHRYSITVLCRLMGVEVEDIPQFEHATTQVPLMARVPLAPHLEQVDRALRTLYDYAADVVARRKSEPREDYISALIDAQESEGALSEEELIWGVANLLFAGHDTTRYQLASAVRAVVEAGVWERLAREPALLGRAVEEATRVYPVTLALTRIAHEDLEIDGFGVPAGTTVMLNYLAICRDPEQFGDPDRYALDRTEKHDLAFGRGVHYCVGSSLAASEMAEALAVLTSRLTDVALTEGMVVTPPWGHLAGPEKLPLRFSRR